MKASIFPCPSWCDRSSRPPLHIFPSTKSAAPRARATHSGFPNTRPATARPRTISPLPPPSTLSPRPRAAARQSARPPRQHLRVPPWLHPLLARPEQRRPRLVQQPPHLVLAL